MKPKIVFILLTLIFINCDPSPNLLYEYKNDVYISHSDGSNPVLLVKNALYPQWIYGTKDKIAFARFSSSGPGWAIFTADKDGKNEKQLTAYNTDGRFSWSQNRNWITYATDRHGLWQIYKVNVNIGKEYRLTHDNKSDHRHPKWSPDGSKIAFSGGLSRNDIWIMDHEGNNLTNLTKIAPGIFSGVNPVWGGQGKYIAYTGIYSGWGGIKIHLIYDPTKPSATPGPIVSKNQASLSTEPCFSPSGDFIFYVDEYNDIYKYNIATQAEQKIASGVGGVGAYMDIDAADLYFAKNSGLYMTKWHLNSKAIKIATGYNPDI